ncbi:MAG: PAS domain-containing protein, partial [Chloroflexota bacterium]
VLRLFVEHSPAAIALFDRDMKYIVASRRYLTDYDLGEQNVVGRSHYEIFPEIPDRWKEIHRRCLAGATERNEEDPFPRASGKLDWVRWEIRPWYESSGGIGGIILFSEVITERRQAQEEIRLHRDRLAELSKKLVEVHETESRAIGRELHDQIGQMLTALKLTVEVAMQLPPDQALQKAVQGRALIDELMARVSSLSLELRPPMLDDLGLVPALLWHVNRFQEQTRVEVDFKHSGVEGKRFGAEIETTAYRVVQESLTNVARHARATRARLEVRAGDGEMEIQIADDGAGFDVESAFAKQRGLGAMRERVQLVGGSFQVESQVGKGARKIVRLPLKEKP